MGAPGLVKVSGGGSDDARAFNTTSKVIFFLKFMGKTLSITALQAFEAAGGLGSFTRAAEELNLTQSAISRQIRGLEDQLGARLFELIRQRIVLTQVCRAYARDVRPILVLCSEPASLDKFHIETRCFQLGFRTVRRCPLPWQA